MMTNPDYGKGTTRDIGSCTGPVAANLRCVPAGIGIVLGIQLERGMLTMVRWTRKTTVVRCNT